MQCVRCEIIPACGRLGGDKVASLSPALESWVYLMPLNLRGLSLGFSCLSVSSVSFQPSVVFSFHCLSSLPAHSHVFVFFKTLFI